MPTRSQQTAAFIAPMCLEMRQMALKARLFELAFVLDIASLEASLQELGKASQATTARRGRALKSCAQSHDVESIALAKARLARDSSFK